MCDDEGSTNAGQEEDLLTPEERRNLRLRRLEGKTRFRNLKSLLMEMANKLRSTTGADSDDYLGIMVGLIFIKRASTNSNIYKINLQNHLDKRAFLLTKLN